jgi:hypothetical protein
MPWLFQFQRKRSEEEFEDTKGVIRILKSKDRQHMVKRKRTKNNLQNITHKTKDQVTRTPLKTVDELRCSGRSKYLQ